MNTRKERNSLTLTDTEKLQELQDLSSVLELQTKAEMGTTPCASAWDLPASPQMLPQNHMNTAFGVQDVEQHTIPKTLWDRNFQPKRTRLQFDVCWCAIFDGSQEHIPDVQNIVGRGCPTSVHPGYSWGILRPCDDVSFGNLVTESDRKKWMKVTIPWAHTVSDPPLPEHGPKVPCWT